MDGRLALPPCSIATEQLVSSGEQWRQNHPSWLYAGLSRQQLAEPGQVEPHRVELYPLGELSLPSGYLVGCDPYLLDVAQQPYRQVVPAGNHRTFCAVVTIDEYHLRVLAGLLVFSDQPIVSWQLGTTGDGDDVEHLGIGEILGFGVDSGTGCLVPVEALPALHAAVQADGGMLEDPLSVAVDSSPCDAAVAAPAPGALPVAAFRSGWGDGVYPTWFGMSETHSPVVAITDFLIFRDPWEPDGEPADASTPQAPHVQARHAAPDTVPDHSDYAGRITAAEAADVLAGRDLAGSAAQNPRPRKGFWARLFGRS